ncbi:MAG: hypothetical protein ACFWT6_03820 [Virgibacillus proomii]|jgi:seryl-tRNA synthetase
MFNIKPLRENFKEVKVKLQHRGEDLTELEKFAELDQKRRKLIVETEQLKKKRKDVSYQIAVLKKENKDAEVLIVEMREVGEQIKKLDEELRVIEEELNALLLSIPNLPYETVPIGDTEDENVEIRKCRELPQFDFDPKPYWDVATELEIIDFERAEK